MPQFEEIKVVISEIYKCRIDWVIIEFVNYIAQAFMLNIALALTLVNGESICVTNLFAGGTIRPNQFTLKKWDNIELEQIDNSFNSEVLKKLEIINCLDPDVNRVVYYYLQFKYYVNTYEGFSSGVLYLYNMIYSMMTFFENEHKNNPSKYKEQKFEKFYKKLGLSNYHELKEDIVKLENIRNLFVAHPALVDWWYFGERYLDFFEKISKIADILLLNFLKYETNHRKVANVICSWGDWFRGNISKIFTKEFFDVDEKIDNSQNESFKSITAKVLLKSWHGLTKVKDVEFSKKFSSDLLFYNYKIHCFIVVKAKNSESEKDLDELASSVSFVNASIKSNIEQETVGLFIVRDSNNMINARYTMNLKKNPASNNLFELLPTEVEIMKYFE